MKYLTFTLVLLFTLNVFSQTPILKTNFGHQNTTIKISSNNKLLATGDDKGVLKIWDISKKKELRSIALGSEIKSINFTEDNKKVIAHSGYEQQIINVYDIESNTIIKKTEIEFKDVVLKSIILKTRPLILIYGSTELSLFNYETNTEVLSVSFKHYSDIIFALSPNEQKLITIEGSKVIIFDANNGEVIQKYNFEIQTDVLAISSDGDKFITSAKKGPLELRNLTNGKLIKSIPVDVSNYIYSIKYSPNGKYIILSDRNKSLQILNSDDFTLKESFSNTYYLAYNASLFDFSNENKYFVYCDYYNVHFNDLATKESFQLNRQGYSISDIEFIPKSNNMLVASRRDIKVFNLNRNNYSKFILAHKKGISHLINFQKESQLISTSYIEKQIKIWNSETFELLDSVKTEIPFQINISSDGKLFYGDELVDLEKKKISELNSKIDPGKDVNINSYNFAFSHDNKHIAYYNYKKNAITILDRNTGSIVNRISTGKSPGGFIGYTPDDKCLFGSHDGNIYFWNAETGKTTCKLETAWVVVSKMYFNSDGSLFAIKTANSETSEIRLYKKNGEAFELFKIIDEGPQKIMKFTSDDQFLLCSSLEGIVYFIDTKTGETAISFIDIPYTKNWVAVTPDGRFDGTEGGFEYLHFVKGMEIIPLNSLFESFYTPNLLARVLSNENFKEPEVKIGELKQPPTVKILSPANNTKTNNKEIAIEVELTDKGGGIDEIRLFHNGKLVEGTARGFKKVVSENESITKTFSLQLVDGENHFKVTAFNNQRVEATPDEITVFYEGQQAQSNLHILAIGINQYKNQKYNLNYAVKDAQGFVEQIKSGSGDIFGNVYTYFMKDAEATKTLIISKLQEIKNKVKQEDVVVFYYAGHGVMNEGIASFPIDFYIIPHDVTQLYGNDEMLNEKAISANELMELSKEIKAQKQLFVFDACQSGGAMQAFAMRGAAEEKAMAQLARSAGIVILSASGTEQFATEFNDLGHGTFTYALIEGLQCQADGGTKDKKITVNELKAWIEDRVPELTEKYKGTAQYPTGYSRGQDFPIVICK